MNSDTKKILLIAILAVIVIGLAVFIFLRPGTEAPPPGAGDKPLGETPSETRTNTSAAVVVPEASSTNVAANVAKPTTVAPAGINQQNASARTFELTVSGNKFSQDTVIVKVGDRARINFLAVDKDYDFTQPDYGFSVVLPKGQKKLIEFQATAEGKFTFYCKSCEGPSKGPVGYLVVVPK